MSLALVLHSGDPARLRSAAALAATAAALERPVTVIWQGAALRRLADGSLAERDPDAAAADLPSAGELLGEARRLGTMRYLSCPTEVLAVGLDESAALAVLDAILSLTALHEILESASQTLFV